MRTIWNGSISFGLVSIPVGLALATKPAARQSDVSFRQLHRECLTPIKQKRWCPTHDREVGPDEIVRGWEVAKGEFVVVEDADLEAIERTEESRSIEIKRFVPLASVDPIYFDRTYFLAPASNAAQRRPYVLLLEAMKGTEMAALGRFILRGQEHFSLIRARGDALVLETLFIAEDVSSQAEIEEAVDDTKVKDAELELARQVIESLESDFEPEELAERVPARPARDARGEARRRGDRAAGARRRGRARRRPDGGAPAERRGRLEEGQRAQGARKEEGGGPPEGEGRRQKERVARSNAAGALLPALAAAPGRASCRSSPGRSARPPARRRGSPPAGRSRVLSTAPRA